MRRIIILYFKKDLAVMLPSNIPALLAASALALGATPASGILPSLDFLNPPPAPPQDNQLALQAGESNGSAPSFLPRATDRVAVTILLKEQPSTPSTAAEERAKEGHNDLIARWHEAYSLDVTQQVGYLVNALSGTIPANQIDALRAQPEVASVERQRRYYPMENTARDLEGVARAYRAVGADGRGVLVSVIDSGIDPTHQDMRLDYDCTDANSPAKIHTFDASKGFTCKIPAGYNYADNSYEVTDTSEASAHGMHVSGIIAGNGSIGDAEPALGRIDGVAPNAQLLAMKIFGNKIHTGAQDVDLIRAIEDSVKLGADIINMSLGSPNGLNDPSDGVGKAIAKAREAGVLVVVAAGNSGLNTALNGDTKDALGVWDDGSLGSPASMTGSFAVASVANGKFTARTMSFGDTTLPFMEMSEDFREQDLSLVAVGQGTEEDVEEVGEDALRGKVAVVKRGEIDFQDKWDILNEARVAGMIIYNSEDEPGRLPAYSVSSGPHFTGAMRNEDGVRLVQAIKDAGGELNVHVSATPITIPNPDALTPSSFTSWGPTPTLDFKPQIAGIGGNVYSSINRNAYVTMSGTSMASPNVAGTAALLYQNLRALSGAERAHAAEIRLMNTASILKDSNGIPYAPRQIGAGLVQVDRALATTVTATVDGEPYVALREVRGTRSFDVTLTNTGDAPVSYTIPSGIVLNESNDASAKIAVSLSSETLTPSVSEVTVPAQGTRTVTFTLAPNMSSPHYVEGWATLTSTTNGQPDLALPFLGFAGDWNAEPILLPVGERLLNAPIIRTDLMTVISNNQPMPVDHNVMGGKIFLSPNDDGIADTVIPQLMYLRDSQETTYQIFDSQGKLVRDLGTAPPTTRLPVGLIRSTQNLARFESMKKFDGYVYNPATKSDEKVPSGDYIYRVRTRLGEGFDWQTVDFPFSVDTTAPVVSHGEYANGALPFTVSDPESRLSSLPQVLGPDGRGLHVDIAEGSDNASGTYHFVAQIPEGTPFVTIRAVNHGLESTTQRVSLATGILYVPAASVINGQHYGIGSQSYVIDGKLELSGTVSPDITRVTVADQDATIDDQHDFSISLPAVEGNNSITVRAFNAAGTEIASRSFAFTYDGAPPTVEVTSGLNERGEAILGEDGTVRVSGKISDNRVAPQDLRVVSNAEFVHVAEDGTFTITIKPQEKQTYFAIIANDGVNTTERRITIAGRADLWVTEKLFRNAEATNAKCMPAMTLCSIVNTSDGINADGTFTLRGTVSPEYGTFTFTPTMSLVDGVITRPQPIPVTVKEDGTFEVTLPMKTGHNEFSVYLTGKDGRVHLNNSSVFVFDNTPPKLDLLSPTLIGGTLFTNSDSVTFAGTISDDGWGYSLNINGNLVADLQLPNAPGEESTRRTFKTPVHVANGDKIMLLALDGSRNGYGSYIPVVVDTTAPDMTVENSDPLPPASSTPARAARSARAAADTDPLRVSDAATFRAAAHDQYLVGLRALVDGNPIDSAVATSDISTVGKGAVLTDVSHLNDIPDTVDPTLVTRSLNPDLAVEVPTRDLAEGEHTLTVESRDLAGNITTQTRTFTVVRSNIPDEVTAQPLTVEVSAAQMNDTEAVRTAVMDAFRQAAATSGVPGLEALSAQNLDWSQADLSFEDIAPLEKGTHEVKIQLRLGARLIHITVPLTLNLTQRTITDQGVSVTAPFVENESVRIDTTMRDNHQVITLTPVGGAPFEDATISVPGNEMTRVFRVDSDGRQVPVSVTYANGMVTFTGSTSASYEIVNDAMETGSASGDDASSPVKSAWISGKMSGGKFLSNTGASTLTLLAATECALAGAALVALRRRFQQRRDS